MSQLPLWVSWSQLAVNLCLLFLLCWLLSDCTREKANAHQRRFEQAVNEILEKRHMLTEQPYAELALPLCVHCAGVWATHDYITSQCEEGRRQTVFTVEEEIP